MLHAAVLPGFFGPVAVIALCGCRSPRAVPCVQRRRQLFFCLLRVPEQVTTMATARQLLAVLVAAAALLSVALAQVRTNADRPASCLWKH